METILEKTFNKPLSVVRSNINKRLAVLKKERPGDQEKYNIRLSWNKQKDRVLIASDYISGEIVLSDGRVRVIAKIPFLMRLFKGKIISILEAEVDKVI